MNEQTRKGRIRTVTDAVGVGVGEDGVLAEVGPATSLLDEGWGETVSVGDVVDQLIGHVVPDVVLSGTSVKLRMYLK